MFIKAPLGPVLVIHNFPLSEPLHCDLGTEGELKHQVELSALPAVPRGMSVALEMLKDGVFFCQVAKYEHIPCLKYTFGLCILKCTLSFKSHGHCPATGGGCQ